jgi:hypothetical protein
MMMSSELRVKSYELIRHILFCGLWAVGCGFLLAGCFKEEDPISRPPQGETEVVQIAMTSKYNKQFFYDLFTNQIISSNDNTIWDLAFDADDNGYHIWLNSSKLMQAYNTGSSDFEGINTEAGAEWTWDYPEGKISENAIGEWGTFSNGNVNSFRNVYIIDRGVNADNVKFGKRKVTFETLNNGTYRIRFAKLSGEDLHVVDIPKDNRYNRVYLSLDNGGQIVQVEPEKNTWDLEFSRYTHIFFEFDTLPYLVTGALINPSGVLVAKDSSLNFNAINFDSIPDFSFINDANAIGYDWKSFDIDDTKYSIIPNKFYIVKDLEGNYYKLRFIDFFSDSGERGYPKFEFARL